MAAFYYGLIFGGRKCLHATSQMRALLHAISLAVNYRLFSHVDVSYKFNGKNDKVVLEFRIIMLGTSNEFPQHIFLEDTFNHPSVILYPNIICSPYYPTIGKS